MSSSTKPTRHLPRRTIRRAGRVEAALDLCIARARGLGRRIVRNAFEVDEVEADEEHGIAARAPGVCALAAYNLTAGMLVGTGIFLDGGTNLDLSRKNLDGEWDAIESGWDGTPWPVARAQCLSRVFYDLGVKLAAKHHPEEP